MTDKEVMQMAFETLDNMVKVDWREWDEFASVEDFVRWAKSRASFTAEALRTALAQPERAECDGGQCGIGGYCKQCPKTQPEPEPVAWFTEDHRADKSATTYSKKMAERWKEKGWPVTSLYTSPPQREWQGLTDEEIRNEANHHVFDESFFNGAVWARGKIKEKNNG